MIPVAGFDTETTGVDVENDRIVSAAIVLLDSNGEVATSTTWVINPGIPIPDEAAAIHGMTTEWVLEHGDDDAAGSIQTLAEELTHLAEAGYPIVVYNAPYDLTLLDREIRRHEVGIVGDIGGVGGIWWDMPRIIDPLVIDKAMDKYRPGKRTLTALAEHIHGITFEGQAHGAVADATTAGRIAQRMLNHDLLRGRQLDLLTTQQVEWFAAQSADFARYLERQGNADRAATVNRIWPYFTPDEGTDS